MKHFRGEGDTLSIRAGREKGHRYRGSPCTRLTPSQRCCSQCNVFRGVAPHSAASLCALCSTRKARDPVTCRRRAIILRCEPRGRLTNGDKNGSTSIRTRTNKGLLRVRLSSVSWHQITRLMSFWGFLCPPLYSYVADVCNQKGSVEKGTILSVRRVFLCFA